MQQMELIIYYDGEKRSGQIETEMNAVVKSPLGKETEFILKG